MLSEEVKSKANEAILQLIDKMTEVGEFTADQIPEVVSELLLWHTLYSGIWFCLGAVVMILSITFWKKAFRASRNRKRELEEAYERGDQWTRFSGSRVTSIEYDFARFASGVTRIVPIIFLVLGFIFMASNLVWLKILVAPKLYLLEYAASLV